MKKLTLILFCCTFGGLQAQTSLTVCIGASATLNATNPQNWTSPSYTLYPSLANNATGSFVITPTISTNYTITLSGINSNQITQSVSTIYSVIVAPPPVSITGPTLVTCAMPQITLTAQSANTSLVYSWKMVGSPSPITGPTFAVNALTATPNSSLAGVFTLQAQDLTSNCTSTQTVLIAQSLYKPIGAIAPSGNLSLSCNIPSLQLTHQSLSGIPNNGTFPTSLSVAAQSWYGPTPSVPAMNSLSYTAAVPGTYTLNIIDLNNGCTSSKTFIVMDNIKYVGVNYPVSPPPANLCGNITVVLLPIISTATAGLTYTWSSPPGAIVSGINSQNLQTNAVGEYTLRVSHPSGCITQVTMEVVYCVGVDQQSEFENLAFYPNPIQDILTVSGLSQESYKWKISDISGKLLQSGKFENDAYHIDIRKLTPGAYIITVTNAKGLSETRKILKE